MLPSGQIIQATNEIEDLKKQLVLLSEANVLANKSTSDLTDKQKEEIELRKQEKEALIEEAEHRRKIAALQQESNKLDTETILGRRAQIEIDRQRKIDSGIPKEVADAQAQRAGERSTIEELDVRKGVLDSIRQYGETTFDLNVKQISLIGSIEKSKIALDDFRKSATLASLSGKSKSIALAQSILEKNPNAILPASTLDLTSLIEGSPFFSESEREAFDISLLQEQLGESERARENEPRLREINEREQLLGIAQQERELRNIPLELANAQIALNKSLVSAKQALSDATDNFAKFVQAIGKTAFESLKQYNDELTKTKTFGLTSVPQGPGLGLEVPNGAAKGKPGEKQQQLTVNVDTVRLEKTLSTAFKNSLDLVFSGPD